MILPTTSTSNSSLTEIFFLFKYDYCISRTPTDGIFSYFLYAHTTTCINRYNITDRYIITSTKSTPYLVRLTGYNIFTSMNNRTVDVILYSILYTNKKNIFSDALKYALYQYNFEFVLKLFLR